jgi:hypothetical protein
MLHTNQLAQQDLVRYSWHTSVWQYNRVMNLAPTIAQKKIAAQFIFESRDA